MAEPALVADGVAAMRAVVDVPVTVKTRIGIDDQDSYEALAHFVSLSAAAGCNIFIVHARKAWLQGLSPRQNREIPPLSYPTVYRLKEDFPTLTIVINGGIQDLTTAQAHLQRVDGVMLGRAAYQNPYLLATVDQQLFGDDSPVVDRHQVVRDFMPYVEQRLAAGVPLISITRHILGLFQGQPGARRWRRYLSENAHRRGAGLEVLDAALALVPEAAMVVDEF